MADERPDLTPALSRELLRLTNGKRLHITGYVIVVRAEVDGRDAITWGYEWPGTSALIGDLERLQHDLLTEDDEEEGV